MSRIDEIQARVHAATLGPWYAEGWAVPDVDTGEFFELEPTDPDAIFIAHAREDIPYLLDENERLTRGIKDIGKICAERHDEIARLTARIEALRALMDAAAEEIEDSYGEETEVSKQLRTAMEAQK